MKRLLSFILTTFLLIGTATPLFADIAIEPNMRLIPNKNITKMRQFDSNLPSRDFAIAALIASGTPGDKIPYYLSKLDQIYNDYETYRVTKNTQLNDAEAGILYLYDKKILTDYVDNQTYLDVLLDTTTYNCVSSAVLFMYLMKRKGFKVIANETPGHVFCTVLANGKEIDVETTNVMGYAPGVVKNVKTSDGSSYSSVVNKNNYEDRKRISGRRLISNIMHNRIVFESEQAYPNEEYILQLIVDRVELELESKEGLQAMYFEVGNVMYRLATQGQYLEALYVAKAFTDKYAHYGKSKLVTQNAAYSFVHLYNTHLDNEKYLDRLFYDYGNTLAKEKYEALYETYILNKVTQLYSEGDLQSAKNVIINALEKLESSQKLTDFMNTYLK